MTPIPGMVAAWAAGHVVHTPDLYDGRTFASLKDGFAYAEQLSFDTVIERGRSAAACQSPDVVYAGFLLGVMPAQLLSQTKAGAKGALLFCATVPLEEFGPWPAGVPGQIHTMDRDDWGDVEVAQQVAASVPELELFLYPGDKHLFADSSLDDYDEPAATELMTRVRDFLERVDRSAVS